jgi:hypothetical protein
VSINLVEEDYKDKQYVIRYETPRLTMFFETAVHGMIHARINAGGAESNVVGKEVTYKDGLPMDCFCAGTAVLENFASFDQVRIECDS